MYNSNLSNLVPIYEMTVSRRPNMDRITPMYDHIAQFRVHHEVEIVKNVVSSAHAQVDFA